MGTSSITDRDLHISERLINVFHLMNDYESSEISPDDRPNSGIWEMSKHAFHGEVYRLLALRDVRGFADYMSLACQKKLTHGLGPGEQVFKAMATPGDGRDANVLLLLDRLSRLAEAVGALSHENPEQGVYGENIAVPLNEIVARIEARLRTPISRPAVMGNFGLAQQGSVIDVRVPDDAYCAFRLLNLARAFPFSEVAEIGGGLGGLALQSIRMGFCDYKIFDLPIINLVQGYFLMSILGPDSVTMFGENTEKRPVEILPYWEFYNRERKFDCVVNRDSLPEIPLKQATAYLEEIERRKAYFLSINQECMAEAGQPGLYQLSVLDLMRDRNYKQITRSPYWVRKGYLEEFFIP
jgi:hypothetical protein